MKKVLFLAFAVAFVLAPTSHAGKLFVGAQWGQGSLEVPAGSGRIDLDDDGYKGYVGYKFSRFISAELGYTDLGSFTGTLAGVTVDADADVVTGMLVATLPASPKLEFFVKAGASDWNTTVIVTDMMVTTAVRDSGTDFAYGAGISYRIGRRIGIRGEWETYEFEGVEDVKFASIGVRFGF